LACKLYPFRFNSRPTFAWLIEKPWRCNSSANTRVLLQVHRNGDVGSPRETGSTKRSNAADKLGCSVSRDRRPAPGLRCRFPSFGPAALSSLMPFRTVRSDKPVACATAAMPPQPNETASVAAQRRRPRSSNSSMSASYLQRIHSKTLASGIVGSSHNPIHKINSNFGNLLFYNALEQNKLVAIAWLGRF
jgi:hypothetical protein